MSPTQLARIDLPLPRTTFFAVYNFITSRQNVKSVAQVDNILLQYCNSSNNNRPCNNGRYHWANQCAVIRNQWPSASKRNDHPAERVCLPIYVLQSQLHWPVLLRHCRVVRWSGQQSVTHSPLTIVRNVSLSLSLCLCLSTCCVSVISWLMARATALVLLSLCLLLKVRSSGV